MPLLLAVGAAWAVFALVGALGDDDQTASDAPSVSSSTTTGVSVRSPGATTTTIVRALPDAPTLGEPTGLHLFADTPGALLDVDLDTGVLERHELGGRLVAGDERGVLVVSGPGLRWHPFPLGSPSVVLDSNVVAPAVGTAFLLEDADGVWTRRSEEFVLLALDGSGVMATAPAPAAADAAGVSGDLLIVAGLGRVFTVDTAGQVVDLGSGVPVAAGHGYVVIDRCDAELVCGPVNIDLATGDARPLPNLRDDLVTGWWLGPGGRTAYAVFADGGAGLFVIERDGVIGIVEPAGPDFDGFENVSFSPDGRWLAATGNGVVWLGPSDGTSGVRVALQGLADGMALLLPTGE